MKLSQSQSITESQIIIQRLLTFCFISLFISFRLNYVIVRPAIVYGLADRQGLSKLLCVMWDNFVDRKTSPKDRCSVLGCQTFHSHFSLTCNYITVLERCKQVTLAAFDTLWCLWK